MSKSVFCLYREILVWKSTVAKATRLEFNIVRVTLISKEGFGWGYKLGHEK